MAGWNPMASWMCTVQLINVPYEIKQKIAECLDGHHHTINPINFGEQLGLAPSTAQHVANHLEDGPSPTMRILKVLQKENKTLWNVYCVLKEMKSVAVQVLNAYWLQVSEAGQGIPRGNQGRHSMDFQTEPSSCGCVECQNTLSYFPSLQPASVPQTPNFPPPFINSSCGCDRCQNNLSHSPSLQPPHIPLTSNFPPHSNDMDDSTKTKTVATDCENYSDDLLFLPPEEPESDSDSISQLMNSLAKIGLGNNPSISDVSDSSPDAQRIPARPVDQVWPGQDLPMPADSSPSSHTSPFSMPGRQNSQNPGGWQPDWSRNGPEQVECSFSSSQCNQPPSSIQPLCGAPLHSEYNLPGPENVPGDGSNFHLGSQQQHWNNPAPEVRAQPPCSQSFSPQPVPPQLQMSPHTPVSLEIPQTAAPVAEVTMVQATQQQALETAQRAQNPSPAPSLQQAQNPSPGPSLQQAQILSSAPPHRQHPKSRSDPYVLVVYGERNWNDTMEAEIKKAVLDLLCNNEIPHVICSPNHHWHAQPEDLVDLNDVMRDKNEFRENMFKKAKAIIIVITPKFERYANPKEGSTKDGVCQDVFNIVRSMRAEVSTAAGNKRIFPVIMTQLGASKKDNLDCLNNTINYFFPSKIQQRDFIWHLQKKLAQR